MPVDDPRNSHRGGTKGDLGRAERLAAQLRENLKRRKARARANPAGGASEANIIPSENDEPQQLSKKV